MTTQSKLTLINGTIDTEGEIRTYRTMNSFEMLCPTGDIGVPPVPFPDDDDWDDFDQADNKAE